MWFSYMIRTDGKIVIKEHKSKMAAQKQYNKTLKQVDNFDELKTIGWSESNGGLQEQILRHKANQNGIQSI